MTIANEWLERCMDAFEEIDSSIFHGVQGVMVFEGEEVGPHVGITICTHGNEPVGLALLWYLLQNSGTVKYGRLFVVVNNLAATRRYLHDQFQALQVSSGELIENVNRSSSIEAILMDDDPNSEAYEHRRATELQPIWQRFTEGGLDLHSTSSDTPPLAVIRNDELLLPQNQKIIAGMPFDIVLTGMFSNLIGSPVVDYFGNETTSKMLYECGQNGTAESFSNAIYYALSWLASFDMLAEDFELASAGSKPTEYYHVTCAVVVPRDDEDYYYHNDHVIMPLEWIEAGQVLAEGDDGTRLIAPESGYAFMAQQNDDVLHAGEELLFIARKQDMRH